ncbi:hypothetical protein OY671_008526, partial [Metschnikowia pulcherrima]
PDLERNESAEIYVARGLDKDLALRVADELMASDASGAHARDELGISEVVTARPLQTALTSAATFSTGALMPSASVAVAPRASLVPIEIAATLSFLISLGALGAWAGGAQPVRSVLRVTFWGALAMAATAGIGRSKNCMTNLAQADTLKVWDAPSRLFHWSLVSAISAAFLSSEDDSPIASWHMVAGWCAAVSSAFRLVWGSVGGEHARFARFIKPTAIGSHVRESFAGRPERSVGHNPLGAIA